jgi:hypothetical protein
MFFGRLFVPEQKMILINATIFRSHFRGLFANCHNRKAIWAGSMLRYDQFCVPNAPWCRCILFRCSLKAKFSNLHSFEVVTNVISLWAWPLFRKYPYVAETLIYWLGFQWVQLRVERGKGDLIYNFVLNHIYFRNLAHQQKDARGGGTLWPTNINQNSSTYYFNLIRSFYSIFLILCSKVHRAETQPSSQSDWLWAGIRSLLEVPLTLKPIDDSMTRV